MSEVRFSVLSNGLRVVADRHPIVPLVAVNLWYAVGSRHERRGEHGLAHLLEHLMCLGAARHSDYPRRLQAVGGGHFNATTNQDRTTYFQTAPPDFLPEVLRYEADRMASLGDSIDQERLDSQRRVVRNEARQSHDLRLAEALLSAAFPVGHPYHHPICQARVGHGTG
ncbi:insulinase family protein [Natronosporangium hydrolyticum]|uniref:Insulinase family protein n=1 Tax=Natronosporangium hydrolyticum TaxID=2811111 RepID=A0A895YDD2_9ACTN|nr:insulinase family protein [Natronosporangium hydrolyticum]QSB12556.1 insulinase family protein [Natronosporangium hydrolyticum]